jgi:hypothetical protein
MKKADWIEPENLYLTEICFNASLCEIFSTAHLHDSLGSRRTCACSEAGFSSQNGDRAWWFHYRRAAYFCALLWAKGLNAKDIHNEMFCVYSGKCLSLKAAHNLVEKFSQGPSRVPSDEIEVRKWLRQQSKDFYAAGFDALIKRWDKCSSVGGYVEIFFLSFEYYMFYVLYPFVTCLLNLPRTYMLLFFPNLWSFTV